MQIKVGQRDVHVWKFYFPDFHLELANFQSILSEQEKLRADRFYFEEDRARYTIGRALLRRVLSRYLSCEPSEISIDYTPYGKPFLACDSSLRFNVSHSRDRMLIGVTLRSEIGVDIEYIRKDIPADKIVKRFFSPQEIRSLRLISEEKQALAFFLCWTRKEAFLKAKGQGLSLPLHQFDVSMDPDRPAELLQTRYKNDHPLCWKIYNIEIDDSYAAAIAVEGQNHSIQLM